MTAITAPSHRLGLRARVADQSDANFLAGLSDEAEGYEFSVMGSGEKLIVGIILDARDSPNTEHFILERHGRSIGHLVIDRAPMETSIVDLRILAGERGRGTGTWALRGVMSDAVATDTPVVTEVMRTNIQARSLLRRLGFRTVAADQVKLRVEWSSPLSAFEHRPDV